jgi:hypothetical protein
MRHDLNNLMARIAAAKWGEWQNCLSDRWRINFIDERKEAEDPFYAMFRSAP